MLSREHARFGRDPDSGEWAVEDLGGQNGKRRTPLDTLPLGLAPPRP